ncbi:hypothetical protein SAMN05444144_11621 [Flavobacterium akiainvivens]|nr:hypothetical protein SAMN05444144_11621 [Flavobacterium akiainvivens]
MLIFAFVSCKNKTTIAKLNPGNDTIVIAEKCAVLYSLPPDKLETLILYSI